MTTRTKTTRSAAPAKATAPRKRAATASSTRMAKPMPAKRPETNAKAAAEALLVQTDLAAMEASDQWQRLTVEVERRRRAADTAVRQLVAGGSDATKTFAAGVRDAVEELRDAVEAAMRTLR